MHPIQILLADGQQALQRGDRAAIVRYRQDLQHYDVSQNPEALHFLGTTSMMLNDPAEGVNYLERSRQLKPALSTLTNLGGAYARLGQWAAAEACFRDLLTRYPDSTAGLAGLGVSLTELGRPEEALPFFRKDVQLRPGTADSHANLAGGLIELGRLREAAASGDEAVRLNPQHGGAHRHRARAWFLLGDYERAWPEYEWRWGEGIPRPDLGPLWNGEPLPGKTILLYAEQGFGDAIQFIRYAPMVKARAGTVVVACDPRMQTLLGTCAGVDRTVPLAKSGREHDRWLPMLSLPRIFQTRLDSVPASIPYIRPEPARVERWRPIVQAINGYRVGVCWRGKASYRSNRKRSFSLAHLAPLAKVPGVKLVSLQGGLAPEEVAAAGVPLVDLPGLDFEAAFVDSAAVIPHLDLVVSCDTAIGHLAGAVGAPVWEAHSHVPDWRWLMGREDTPWYPTMRIFPQPRPGDWFSVFAKMADVLAKLAHSPTRRV